MSDSKQNWYCIKFDVPKNKNITALDFSKKMNEFLENINEFNHSIVGGIDDTYTVASYVEDFEAGSVKWWIVDRLNKVDDNAIDKFVESPIKTTIAGILKVSKKKTIAWLSNNDYKQLSQQERELKIIEPIIEEVESKKQELSRNELSQEIKIDKRRLMKSLSVMSQISKELDENVFFIDDYDNQDKEIKVSKEFEYNESTQDNAEEIIKQNENTIIDTYTLLTPTSKEDCLWELHDGSGKIKAKMEDKRFFNDYINNSIKLGGDEKLQVKMKIETYTEGKKIKKEYTMLEVQILELVKQSNLL
jgi:hypothetical protein